MVIRQVQLFTFPGVMNKHNCRTWAATYPFVAIEAAMNSSKVNICCAISDKQIIAPYFFRMMQIVN